jgi:hypothetical protein
VPAWPNCAALDGEGFDQVEAQLCAMAGVERIEQVIARLG